MPTAAFLVRAIFSVFRAIAQCLWRSLRSGMRRARGSPTAPYVAWFLASCYSCSSLCFLPATIALVGSVLGVKDLLPYLAGAASAFAVQFLIQVYVAPLVETRKRRLERWERDVLDLGEFLSGTVSDAARQANSQQFFARSSDKMVGNSDYPPEFVAQERQKYEISAREATSAFHNHVNYRAEWLMDRISAYRSSDQVRKFTFASMRYRLHLMGPSPGEWREMSDDDWDAWWTEEGKLLVELILDLRRLTWDWHTQRISWLRWLGRTRRSIKQRLVKIRRKPVESNPTERTEGREVSSV